MANTKISQRTAASTITGAETIGLIQSGADRKATLDVAIGDYVTPEKYGAVGDGVTDDTTAFQNALNSGARGVLARKIYKTTAALQLQSNQVLFGLPKTMQPETVVDGTTPRLKFRPGAANKVCVKNAAGANNCGIEDLLLDLNDNSHTGVQFSSSYGNTASRLHFAGTMRIGLLATETYVGRFEKLCFAGASVRTANVFLGVSNGTVIDSVHTSGFPNDVNECLYGVVASNSGYGNSIRNCVLQGNTIGIAQQSCRELTIDTPYFENTLCNMRLGDPTSGQGVVTVIGGGPLGAPSGTHTQYAKRGPVIYANCNTLTMIGPGFESTADNTTARGPWPIVFGPAMTRFAMTGAFHFNGAASSNVRDLMYRESAGNSVGIAVTGSQFEGTYNAQEILLKKTGAFGSTCYGISVDNGGAIVTTSYQPAVIFAAIDALLTTNLPTGASLVL